MTQPIGLQYAPLIAHRHVYQQNEVLTGDMSGALRTEPTPVSLKTTKNAEPPAKVKGQPTDREIIDKLTPEFKTSVEVGSWRMSQCLELLRKAGYTVVEAQG